LSIFLDFPLRRRHPWFLSLLASCTLASAGSAQPQKPAVLPPVTAYSLDRQKITIPAELAGQTNLLILSFEAEQQKDVDSWLPAAQAVQHTNFQFHYYEMPVFGRENILFRWWDTSSLRSDQTDPESWHWIVPLFVDKHRFMSDLTIATDKKVVVLLVDKQGHVLWRAIGPLTPDKRAAFLAAMSGH
jgi:hypothetical protein